ncbi:hypothetical protein NL108_000204 [Boleophthalmus pectinirostris]|uniref:uncharacterized protein si:dkey-29h14.10 n=1 Tax=Boleophthalmus pectinirostris TaxID=150288 RepID=UPI00243095AF|nr:uncharacterized protein si:dkey-29h14.10 [Boleophthalmus pectinirostris]XP_055019382.1 uncharacterized protein si:dkey-29h14.10 [Boleophthalmus pectinirostris]XP_055019383.1 uncharacterized protein si:dkey-29h14.10 [Boleophthalmus pectinirostris]KAJ0065949.1 hypothetical protein NL108_000204 [Boleophthalmus pectinirostris]
MADNSWHLKANKDKLYLNKVTDRHEHNQIMGYKAFSMSTLVRTMQRMVEKNCRRACQLLCCSIDNLMCDRLTICPGKKEEGHTEEVPVAATAAWSPPSTILIVNISNSTLIDCVIGNETCPPTVAEKQPLMQGNIHDVHGPSNFSLPSIQISSSNLSCVIIGDNNYMQVEQTVPSEEENGDDHENGS